MKLTAPTGGPALSRLWNCHAKEDAMPRLIGLLIALVMVALTSVAPALAQGAAAPSGDPAVAPAPAPPSGHAPPAADAAPCARMAGMQAGHEMMPMMGMMDQAMTDPRMMEMHGEMMKAMGEIMMKYARRAQSSKRPRP